MALTLPASIQADFLARRRAGTASRVRSVIAPALLVAGCAVLSCVPLYGGPGWCTAASAATALAGGFALTRSRLTAALLRARFGWCAALPVNARATTRVLLGMTAVAWTAAAASGTLSIALAAIPAPHPHRLGLELVALAGGLAIGGGAAVWRTLRRGALVHTQRLDGIREPLLALPWLNDRALPHLLDWQRRAALVAWRRGGGFALVGLALAGVPDGAAIPAVASLALLVVWWSWLAVTMRACATVTGAARRVLGATPAAAPRLRRASLRYPLIAASCALIVALGGTALAGQGLTMVATWAACALAVSAWPLTRIIRATRCGRPP